MEDKLHKLTNAYLRRDQKYIRKRTVSSNDPRSKTPSTSTSTNNLHQHDDLESPQVTSHYSVRIPRFFYMTCFGIFLLSCYVTMETWIHIFWIDQSNHQPEYSSPIHTVEDVSTPTSSSLRRSQTTIESSPETTSTSKSTSTSKLKSHEEENSTCLSSLYEMTESEQHPQKGTRHMVDPPLEENITEITLVCCETTKGSLSIAVHPKWAPLGAHRFLEMIQSQYFHSGIPLMRCLKNFLCQFGLSGDPHVTKQYDTSIQDDPNWLPEGKEYRTNQEGIKRYARGYMGYAGAGPHSRSNQFIMALGNNAFLGGGSPWEVPFGEVVGEASYETLRRIYTGYGEHGPSQGRLRRQGVTDSIKEEFPLLDYITSCAITQSMTNDNNVNTKD